MEAGVRSGGGSLMELVEMRRQRALAVADNRMSLWGLLFINDLI